MRRGVTFEDFSSSPTGADVLQIGPAHLGAHCLTCKSSSSFTFLSVSLFPSQTARQTSVPVCVCPCFQPNLPDEKKMTETPAILPSVYLHNRFHFFFPDVSTCTRFLLFTQVI